jgi:hypothetical protein
LKATTIDRISSFSLSHYTPPHQDESAISDKEGVGGEEDGTDGLTTLLAQYMSLSITARTASAFSASTISKLPFIVSDAGSDMAPPISVPRRQGASGFKV